MCKLLIFVITIMCKPVYVTLGRIGTWMTISLVCASVSAFSSPTSPKWTLHRLGPMLAVLELVSPNFLLFPRLPLDTGITILRLSGIRWMFFCLFVLLSGNILPDIVDSLEVRISMHQQHVKLNLSTQNLRLILCRPYLILITIMQEGVENGFAENVGILARCCTTRNRTMLYKKSHDDVQEIARRCTTRNRVSCKRAFH
jgi:hypothetical protein